MKGRADCVISYGWNRVAYTVLRSLYRMGVRTAVGDESPIAMSKWSRLCATHFVYSSFYRRPDAFVNDVLKVCRSTGARVYLPVHEETLVAAKARALFEAQGIAVPVADYALMCELHRKDAVLNRAAQVGIPVPETLQPRTLRELDESWDRLSDVSGVVVKTVCSNSAKGVYCARTRNELHTIHAQLMQSSLCARGVYPIVQEYVPGEGWGVSVLCNNGEVKALFTHRRLREKLPTGGTSTRRVSARHPLLEKYARALFTACQWHGVAMAEFRYDPKTARAWLIEVNPRLWGSLALAVAAGVDFPAMMFELASTGDVNRPPEGYAEGVEVRWALGEILSAIAHLRAGKFSEACRALLPDFTVAYDDVMFDDPLVFVAECASYLARFVRSGSLNPTLDAVLDVTDL